jgi:hypothetical protein
VELYLHSPIRLHCVKGTNLPLILLIYLLYMVLLSHTASFLVLYCVNPLAVHSILDVSCNVNLCELLYRRSRKFSHRDTSGPLAHRLPSGSVHLALFEAGTSSRRHTDIIS